MVYALQAVFDLVDRVSGPARQIAGQFQQLSALSARLDAQLDRMGQGLQLAGVGAALGAPLALATRQAIALEDALADVRKVVDFPTPEALTGFQRELLNLGRQIPLTTTELTQIAAAAGQAGIALNELIPFVQDAARVAVAFGIPALEAGDALAKLRAQLNLSQPQVVLLTDAVNTLSNNLAATAPEILNVLRRVGATGQILGLSGEQVAAFGSALLAVGTAPEVAATGLNALFMRLATAPQQPREFQEALERLGLTAQGLAQAVRKDAAGAIAGLLERIRRAPDQLAILSNLFGQEYSDDIARLANALPTLQRALGLVAEPAQFAGSALAEFQARVVTTQSKLVLLKNAVERIAVVVGNILLPPFSRAVEGAAAFLQRLGDLLVASPLLRNVLVSLAAGASGLLVVLGTGAIALASFGFVAAQARIGLLMFGGVVARLPVLLVGLRAGLVGMAVSLRAVGLALMANPLGLAIAAFGALTAVIVHAWRNSEEFRAGILATFKSIRTAFAPMVAEVQSLGAALAEAFRPIGGVVQASMVPAKEAFDVVLRAIFFGLGLLVGILEGLAKRIAPIFAQGLAGVVQVVRGFVMAIGGLLRGDLNQVVAGAKLIWEGLRNVLLVPIKLGGVIWDVLRRSLEQILAWVRGLAAPFFEAGRGIVQGLAQGIVSLATAPIQGIRNIGQQALDALKGLLGIRSPSRAFAQLGAASALGFLLGLQGMAPAVERATAELVRLPAVEVSAGFGPLAVTQAGPVVQASPGATPQRPIQIHIERLELPSVREPDEFVEALKRLFLSEV